MRFAQVRSWLRRRAENFLAAMLAVMFVAFLIQIVFRYFFNFPVGWTTELTLICWLWMVLWGSAFVLRESEEIRFDLIHSAATPTARRVMGIAAGGAIVVLYVVSLPAAIKYVSFMKVEKSSYLHIRLDYLYSIYVLFAVAVIARHLRILWRLLRGTAPEASDPTQPSSGL